jgi:transcriptional regulator with XRE-family HTH domain
MSPFKLDPIAIGERIQARRLERGESQKDVGKACGLSQNSVMKIERGRTENSRFIAAIWTHLGLDLTELSDIYQQQRPLSRRSARDPHTGFATVEVTVPREIMELVQISYETVKLPASGRKGILITWIGRDGATACGLMDQSMVPDAEEGWREMREQLAADQEKS